MMRTILVVVLVAALAVSAGAYDILYSNDTAATREQSSFAIGASFIYFTADKWYDANGEALDGVATDYMLDQNATYTGMWFPIDVSFGVLDGLEIGATPIFIMDTVEHPNSRETVEVTGTGIGDTWLWAKYALSPEPMLTVRLAVKAPTGNDEVLPSEDELVLGSGQIDIDGAIMFGVPVAVGFLDGCLGYRYRLARTYDESDDPDWKPGNEIHFFLGYSHFLNEAMSVKVGADGYFGSDNEFDYGNAAAREFEVEVDSASGMIYVNPGFDYLMESGLSLGFDVHYPLMGANNNANWGVGFSVGWGS